MKNLLIIGARGYGREIYGLAHNSIGHGTEFVIKGFLDDKKDALDGYKGYAPIVGDVENYQIQENDMFVCALGDVKYKKKYVALVQAKGGHFINLIHNTASIGRNTVLGEGCILSRYVNISCDVVIGDFVTFQAFVCIGHDAHIGNFCHLNTYAFMGGFSKLGNMVTLHTGAILHPKIEAEDNSTIGAASVAIRKVKKGATVYGNPAVVLKF